MDIYFTKHALHRKTQRNDWLIRTPTWGEANQSVPSLEKLLVTKGKWFGRKDPDTGMKMIYCIVNKLEVYCGVIEGQEGHNKAIITTYYPYIPSVKKKLYRRREENFESFDVNDPDPEVFKDPGSNNED